MLKVEKFFMNNSIVKELIYSLKPNESDSINKEAKMNYIAKFLKTLGQLKKILLDMSTSLYNDESVNKLISGRFEEYEKLIMSNCYDLDNIYEQCCFNLNNRLVEKVQSEFSGNDLFTKYKDTKKILNNSTSINEIAYVLHAAIVNNEAYYKSVPEIAKKYNDFAGQVTFRGIATDLGKNLFCEFPLDVETSDTDIVALNNKILMMIRDREHSLTIEIDITDEAILVNYSIPKICNYDIASKIKGITFKPTTAAASGSFVSDKEHLLEDIFIFIKSVPMESDMEWSFPINTYQNAMVL